MEKSVVGKRVGMQVIRTTLAHKKKILHRKVAASYVQVTRVPYFVDLE